MARKRNQPQSSKSLSIEQMKATLPRLENRLANLDNFDPNQIARRNDPRIKVLSNSIDNFLTNTFGKGTDEYDRYAPAIYLDTAGIDLYRETPLAEVIQG